MGLGLGLLLCWGTLGLLEANEDTRLYNRLFADYDKKTRPVRNVEDVVEVSVKLTLTNLISLNEKEETLTTNVWITQTWTDYRLEYNSSDFGGILALQVPADKVWLPDVVLENNIDGQFDVAYFSNVLIYPGGSMYWLPPAIFRSTCSIEVTFFPFDWQNCSLVFRSQTYNAREVQLTYSLDESGNPIQEVDIDPEAFTENGEWAIKHRPARSVLAPVSGIEAPGYSEMHFFLIIQRKPLFYIINIITPCVLISSLVVLVYFLPAQEGSGDLAQCAPHWYLIFVMVVATLIVTNCVIVLNIALRSPSTHVMSERLKHVFLEVLPRYLGATLEPAGEDPWDATQVRRRSSFGIMLKAEEYILKKPRSEILFERQGQRHGLQRRPGYQMPCFEQKRPPLHWQQLCGPHGATLSHCLSAREELVSITLLTNRTRIAGGTRGQLPWSSRWRSCKEWPQRKTLGWVRACVETLTDRLDVQMTSALYKNLANVAPEIKECVDACNFVTDGTKDQNAASAEMENWVLIGQVIDKLCFWAAILLFTAGTLAIFLMGYLNTVPDTPFPVQAEQ
ncbi:acetylcholine receptor subunit epsilon isoform X2 [Eublepharis macularius]|uniref:Acetylcholine receptor subunit epsilon isoform X2 n=1 Tax=Eublepharis macularius TaxID=481883 RepID=A0AA97LDL0_EUBMA|nr:acetylcholine receptor subunit epsilon isoform X2 [Eublepharis macularius]